MAVKELNDGRWIVYYRVPGKKSKKREYFGRGLEGQRKARQRDKDIGARKKRPSRPSTTPTFTELAKVYLLAKEGSMTDSTRDSTLYKLYGIVDPEIGGIPVGELTQHRVDQFVNKRLRTVKKTTVHRDLTVIQAILRWAVKRKYIAENPIDGYDMPVRDDQVIRPATIAEIKALLTHSPEHLKRVLTICAYTGARPGPVEVFSLKWGDVNWHDKTITVTQQKRAG
ncbi:hypothetical protein LCGC14_1679050 [marine sediment metagenome]|uniref:Core-binding (CB) domain-containing protein n=1 Tax=marine sediment metagenome TaxID=412755 RepID=A0A0F9KP67_9ZZZZ